MYRNLEDNVETTIRDINPYQNEYVLSGLEAGKKYQICVGYVTDINMDDEVEMCDVIATAEEEKNILLFIIIGAIAGLVLIIILVLICILCCRRKNQKKSRGRKPRLDPEGQDNEGFYHDIYLNNHNGHLARQINLKQEHFEKTKHKKKGKERSNLKNSKSESQSDLMSTKSDATSVDSSPTGAPSGLPPNSGTRYKYPDIREIETVFIQPPISTPDISEGEEEEELNNTLPKFKKIKRADAEKISAMITRDS